MENDSVDWGAIEASLEIMIDGHNKALLKLGRRIVPTLTPEDLLQPNDYSVLENHPEFRYEEGVLAGMRTVQMALWAMKCEAKLS